MTTPRIEEMIDKRNQIMLALRNLEHGLQEFHGQWVFEASEEDTICSIIDEALTQAHQAGIDEAVEAERNRIKEWVRTQVSDGSGQCIHYEEILEALQDNK